MNCEECKREVELTEDEQAECNLIGEFVDRIMNTEGCPHCIFEALLDLYYIGKDNGYEDCRAEMLDFLIE